uniref:Uncharacterized protein n=1 Tax=Ditylenchus dipsaci TaxID=166011 RepID=A0A915DUA2_9BILA
MDNEDGASTSWAAPDHGKTTTSQFRRNNHYIHPTSASAEECDQLCQDENYQNHTSTTSPTRIVIVLTVTSGCCPPAAF